MFDVNFSLLESPGRIITLSDQIQFPLSHWDLMVSKAMYKVRITLLANLLWTIDNYLSLFADYLKLLLNSECKRWFYCLSKQFFRVITFWGFLV